MDDGHRGGLFLSMGGAGAIVDADGCAGGDVAVDRLFGRWYPGTRLIAAGDEGIYESLDGGLT